MPKYHPLIKTLFLIAPRTSHLAQFITLVIFCLLLPTTLQAQSTFSKVYITPDHWARAYDIIPLENGDFAIANSTIDWWTDENLIQILIVNEIGDIIHEWSHPVTHIGPVYEFPLGRLIRLQEGGYLISTSQYLRGTYRTILYRLDEQLNLLWEREIGTTANREALRHIIQARDGSFILSGIFASWLSGYTDGQMYIMKLDSLGNQIWENKFGIDSLHIYGESIAEDHDGGFVLGGGAKQLNNPDIQRDDQSYGMIYKTDSLGNVLWHHLIANDPDENENERIKPLPQGGYISWGTQSWYQRPYLRFYDVDGTFLNQVNLYDSGAEWKPRRRPFEIIFAENNDLILCGAEHELDGWVARYTPTGEEIWSRLFWYHTRRFIQDSLVYPGTSSHLYDIDFTPDGGLVVAGRTKLYTDLELNLKLSQLWVMKLDSMGCLEENCADTITLQQSNETYVGITQQSTPQQPQHLSLNLYPNPAKNTLYLTLPTDFIPTNCMDNLASDNKARHSLGSRASTRHYLDNRASTRHCPNMFHITDLMGRQIISYPITSTATIPIDIHALPTGMYIGSLMYENEIIAVEKFVVE